MNGPVNIETVKRVAKGLEPLLEKVVFAGGAVIELYANDLAATPLRPTTDVDVVVQLTGYGKYANLEERLAKLGFHHDTGSKVACRYTFKGITVDIMPTDKKILGFSNRWYISGMDHVIKYEFDDGIQIKLFEPPYFLASKFEAFKGRGKDYRTSHDFEDIIYFLDNRKDWEHEIITADSEVREYLKSEFQRLLEDKFYKEYISAHLPAPSRKERLDRITEGLQEIIQA